MSVALALLIVTVLGLLTLGIALSVMIESWIGSGGSRPIVVSLAVTGAAWASWLVMAGLIRPDLSGQNPLVVAALAGVAAVLAVTSARVLDIALPRLLLFTSLWVAAVFTPVSISLFSLDDGVLGNTLATLDLAGALPVLVTAGSTGIVLLALTRRSVRPAYLPAARGWFGLATILVVWALWLVWMAGLEAAVDSVTPRILLSGLLAPLASLCSWLIVQRVRHATTTAQGVAAGLFCGLVAITPGSGYLGPVGAILTGAIAGAVSALIGFAVVQRTGRPAWVLAVVLVTGAGLGTGLLGAFATRFGLMFTGQPEVLMSQFASAALVALWSAGLSAVLWLLLLRRALRRDEPKLPA